MTTVYLIRHCEAEGNVREIFQGHTDGIITDKGRLQLEKLAERCREIPFEVFYSSPLKRAYLTAEAAVRHHGLPIIKDKGFIEINGGDMEGHRWDALPALFPEEYPKWVGSYADFKAPNGDSVLDIYIRMRDSVLNVVRENPGKVIGIASHGGVIHAFLAYAHGMKPEELGNADFWCDNTSISRVDFDENLKPLPVFFNDAEHIKTSPETAPHQMMWREDLNTNP